MSIYYTKILEFVQPERLYLTQVEIHEAYRDVVSVFYTKNDNSKTILGLDVTHATLIQQVDFPKDSEVVAINHKAYWVNKDQVYTWTKDNGIHLLVEKIDKEITLPEQKTLLLPQAAKQRQEIFAGYNEKEQPVYLELGLSTIKIKGSDVLLSSLNINPLDIEDALFVDKDDYMVLFLSDSLKTTLQLYKKTSTKPSVKQGIKAEIETLTGLVNKEKIYTLTKDYYDIFSIKPKAGSQLEFANTHIATIFRNATLSANNHTMPLWGISRIEPHPYAALLCPLLAQNNLTLYAELDDKRKNSLLNATIPESGGICCMHNGKLSTYNSFRGWTEETKDTLSDVYCVLPIPNDRNGYLIVLTRTSFHLLYLTDLNYFEIDFSLPLEHPLSNAYVKYENEFTLLLYGISGSRMVKYRISLASQKIKQMQSQDVFFFKNKRLVVKYAKASAIALVSTEEDLYYVDLETFSVKQLSIVDPKHVQLFEVEKNFVWFVINGYLSFYKIHHTEEDTYDVYELYKFQLPRRECIGLMPGRWATTIVMDDCFVVVDTRFPEHQWYLKHPLIKSGKVFFKRSMFDVLETWDNLDDKDSEYYHIYNEMEQPQVWILDTEKNKLWFTQTIDYLESSWSYELVQDRTIAQKVNDK